MEQDILCRAYDVDEAQQALADLTALKDDLAFAGQQADEASTALSAIESLHTRLAEAAKATLDAQRVGGQLLSLQQDLLCQHSQIEPAQEALDGLILLRQVLQAEGQDIETAQQRTHALLALKDAVIDQTRDLAQAIETLELTSDLREQFHEAAMSFGQIRTWMVEVVALQPTFQRAMAVLDPLVQLGNLRRLSDEQLRDVASTITQQNRVDVAEKPATADGTAGESAVDIATGPASDTMQD